MEACFKQNLRSELDFQELTVKELSAITGIPKPTIDCYLSARQVMPPADVAVRIAKALHVTVEYLIDGSDARIVPQEYEEFLPFRALLTDVKKLNDSQRETVAVMVHALAERM